MRAPPVAEWKLGREGVTRGALIALVLMVALLVGCSSAGDPRDLRELVLQDSTYLTPETMEPFSGRVFRVFATDSTINEIEGELLDGTWHGELLVYHPSGRIRYMGSFANGDRCGPWTENTRDEELGSVYDQLVSEVEAMGLYPPCPPGS